MKKYSGIFNLLKKNSALLKASLPLLAALLIIISAFLRYFSISRSAALPPDDNLKISSTYNEKLCTLYPDFFQYISPLSYETPVPELHLKAFSAILINADTGAILYEKNADAVIPPASMTKLFLIYSVMKHIESGEYSFSSVIPVDERSWASSMPPHSSLMFLGKDHKVTLLELLKGLSISSGNDASYAIAYGIFGSMENFLSEINDDIRNLGLTHTKIVESSGYSEENLTTPREMAIFSRIYVEKYPELLSLLHAVPENTYPEPHNLPLDQRNLPSQSFNKGIPDNIWTSIRQKNTNPLLGVLPGCDGIKTGHIDESGYNLSLTTIRNGTRYISITMGGPGNSIRPGDTYRAEDGALLHEYAHSSFFLIPDFPLEPVRVPCFGGNKKSITLVPLKKSPLLLPMTFRDKNIEYTVTITEYPSATCEPGDAYGYIELFSGNQVFQRIPLVAAESLEPAGKLFQSADNILMKIYRNNHKNFKK